MNSGEESDIILKILLLGDTSVGKTSILKTYNGDKFEENSIGTIGVEYAYKIITYKNMKIKLQIWDTSGEEKFRSITNNFYRNADGLFLVYDLTREDTFENIRNWLRDIKEYNGDLKIIILGNKLDLFDQRVISIERATNYATRNNLKHIETSAKDGTNIEKSFEALIELIINGRTKEEMLAEITHKDTSVTIVSESKSKGENKKKSCC